MQHGTKREEVLDVLENAIAVMRREREVHGRPVGDVLVNLETAHLMVSQCLVDRPAEPVSEYPDRGFGVCPDCGIGFSSADSRPCGGFLEDDGRAFEEGPFRPARLA